jgi:ABC-2 type transport system permease protein
MVFERVKQMLIKEVKQVRRDPRMRAVILVVPIVQSLLFGYAVTTDVRHVKTAVYDMDNSVESRELISRFLGSGYFDAVQYVHDDETARDALDRGRARVVIHLRHGFGEAVRNGRTAEAQLLIDGTDSNTAGLVLQYASGITTNFNQNILLTRSLAATGVAQVVQPLNLEVRSWFNENLESRNYFVPGVIALLVAVTTLLLTSMAVVREKEIGTIEQIIVSPITKTEFILGKSVPFVIIAYMNVLLVTAVSVFWFDIPIRGSILLLLGATGLYLLTMIGIGLFISTVASTQQQAMMSAFFFIFPAILLSGFIFPIANMPVVVQWFTFLDPLRYFLIIIRGVFLKGVGAGVLWPQLAGLAILGAATLTISVRVFKKTLG